MAKTAFSMRIYIKVTECEKFIIKKGYGCRDVRNIIRGRVEKLALSLPHLEENETSNRCELSQIDIRIYNEEAIKRLKQYADINRVPPGTLVRRLAVDPLVLRYLVGGVFDSSPAHPLPKL